MTIYHCSKTIRLLSNFCETVAELPTLTVWAVNTRSHDLASKSHGESENLEIAGQFR